MNNERETPPPTIGALINDQLTPTPLDVPPAGIPVTATITRRRPIVVVAVMMLTLVLASYGIAALSIWGSEQDARSARIESVCFREATKVFFAAVGDGVDVLLRQNTTTLEALLAIAEGDDARRDEALARLGESGGDAGLIPEAERADIRLEAAVRGYEIALESC